MAHSLDIHLDHGHYQPGELIENGKYRVEFDALGAVRVPAERLWGAQTQRSLFHFSIGEDRMPLALCRAYGYIKKAAATVNAKEGVLPQHLANAIIQAADEVIQGKLDLEFPLFVWQTGSGTQTNMNVNEVIANRAIQILKGKIGTKTPIHPNDHVNMSQSSNDTFPTAMHLATVLQLHQHLFPSLQSLIEALRKKAIEWVDVVKIGRTHLQDATPLTVGQEWSGYVVQLQDALHNVKQSLQGIHKLAAGGTAVGTGINTLPNFGRDIAKELSSLTGHPFVTAPNKFAAQAALDAMVAVSATLRGVAVALMKIANDIRWLSCGPRGGLHELHLPANEPGSSIMPGKVNPTQAEALMMVCIQTMANDTAVTFAGSLGNFELNVMQPVIIKNVLHSISILADACHKFRIYCIEGIQLNLKQIQASVSNSLMLVTALCPVIGYDKASEIAQKASKEHLSLREAAVQSGYLSAEDFDKVVNPAKMVGNPHQDLGLLT